MTTVELPAAGMTTLPAAGTSPLPDHGTLRRAMGDRHTGRGRCYCGPCRETERRYGKRRKYLADRGTPILVDAAPAREHVAKLREAGDAFTLVADRHGIPRRTLHKLQSGELRKLRRETAAAVLSVVPGSCLDPYKSVSAVGAVRRVRALIAAGHSLNAIQRAAEIQHSTASELLNGTATMMRRSAIERVEQAYRLLSSSRGDSVRSLNRAAREGWKDPAWWEDWGRIDDPDFDPATVERELNRDELGALRRDEVEHLASYGLDPEQIAERLGLHLSTVRTLINEWRSGQRRDRKKVAA